MNMDYYLLKGIKYKSLELYVEALQENIRLNPKDYPPELISAIQGQLFMLTVHKSLLAKFTTP